MELSELQKKVTDALLEEACRQWYCFIDETPDRLDGEGFAYFFREICEQKQDKYIAEFLESSEEKLADFSINLSDMVFHVPEQKQKQKPDAPLIGAYGSMFDLLVKASRTLQAAGMKDDAGKMCQRFIDSSSYTEALSIIGEYVNFVEAGQSGPAESESEIRQSGIILE